MRPDPPSKSCAAAADEGFLMVSYEEQGRDPPPSLPPSFFSSSSRAGGQRRPRPVCHLLLLWETTAAATGCGLCTGSLTSCTSVGTPSSKFLLMWTQLNKCMRKWPARGIQLNMRHSFAIFWSNNIIKIVALLTLCFAEKAAAVMIFKLFLPSKTNKKETFIFDLKFYLNWGSRGFATVSHCCSRLSRLLPAFATVMRMTRKKPTVQTPTTGSTTASRTPETETSPMRRQVTVTPATPWSQGSEWEYVRGSYRTEVGPASRSWWVRTTGGPGPGRLSPLLSYWSNYSSERKESNNEVVQ